MSSPSTTSIGITSGAADALRGPANRSKRPSSSSNNPAGRAISIDVESIRLQFLAGVSRLRSRVSLTTLRPLPVFLGINPANACLSAEAFAPPVKKLDKTTPEKVKRRMQLNFSFFLTNYVLIAAMVAVVIALLHPGMMFFVGVVYALWSLHHFLIRQELIVFGIAVHSLLTIQQRFYLLTVLTVLVIVWKCLVPTLLFALISSVLIVSHAFLRDPKHIETCSDLLLANTGSSTDDDEEEGGRGIGGDGMSGGGGNGSSGSSGSEILVERPITQRRGGDVI